MMRLSVTEEAFRSAFTTLDADHSGELNFREFLDMMRLMRDGEGLFAASSQKLPAQVKFLDVRILRRTLEYFRYSKAHINLLDKSELIGAFCDSFGIAPIDNLRVKLAISTTEELYEAAKRRDANKFKR